VSEGGKTSRSRSRSNGERTKAGVTRPDVELTQVRRSGLATRVGTPVRVSFEPVSGTRVSLSLSGRDAPAAKVVYNSDDDRMDLEKARASVEGDDLEDEDDVCEKDGTELVQVYDDLGSGQVGGATQIPDVPVLPTDGTLKCLPELSSSGSQRRKSAVGRWKRSRLGRGEGVCVS